MSSASYNSSNDRAFTFQRADKVILFAVNRAAYFERKSLFNDDN